MNTETEELNATNANYERVIAIMNKLLTERYEGYCSCRRCKCDIAAIALNYLPPHYIVENDAGKEFGSPWIMVETAVTEAIDRVMEHPNHPWRKPQTKPMDEFGSNSILG